MRFSPFAVSMDRISKPSASYVLRTQAWNRGSRVGPADDVARPTPSHLRRVDQPPGPTRNGIEAHIIGPQFACTIACPRVPPAQPPPKALPIVAPRHLVFDSRVFEMNPGALTQ